jgi:hypothetical protein
MVATVSRKKHGASRRTFNISDDLYLKLQKVASKEYVNATQQLERSLDAFFKAWEKENGIKIDDIEIPVAPVVSED